MAGATFCAADSVRDKGDDGDDDSVCSDGDGTFSRTRKTYFKVIKVTMNSKGTLNRALISH